jgi:CRP-like cAMP-binding protein
MPKKVVRRPAARPPSGNGVSGNLLLAMLPPAEYARLAPLMKSVPLTLRLSLLKRDQPIDHLFFPEGGVCSLTTSMKDGDAVEVATVGREGMIGFEVFLGSAVASVDAFVQVPGGSAQRLPLDAFRREMDSKGSLFHAMARYSRALLGQIVQTAACNRLHKVHGRCARWLLLTHDRVDSDEFLLSHEFLSFMLGVERSTVTLIAGALQKAGLIRYVHGRVTIVDRQGLERAACECYEIAARHFADLGLEQRRPDTRARNSVG